jgi:hypothetical protein
MDEELQKMLKYLGLRGLLANWDHYIDMAKKSGFSSVRLLKYVVEQEYKIKQENARKRRISIAKIPEPFVIETFPFDRQLKLNKKIIFTLIDAVSCAVLYPEYTAISTSGAATDPAWLQNLIINGCKIYCGFDADRTGDTMANKMIKQYPSIKRLRPHKHDWNEVLQSISS